MYCRLPEIIMIINLQGRIMTENLSIFSTIEDLRNCSDDTLEAGIDSVSRDVVIAYILELRERVKEAEQGLWLVNINLNQLTKCAVSCQMTVQNRWNMHYLSVIALITHCIKLFRSSNSVFSSPTTT